MATWHEQQAEDLGFFLLEGGGLKFLAKMVARTHPLPMSAILDSRSSVATFSIFCKGIQTCRNQYQISYILKVGQLCNG